MTKTFAMIMILLIVSSLSVMFMHQPVDKKTKIAVAKDMIFDEVYIQDFDKSGALNHEMKARHAYFDPNQKMDFYEKPEIQYYVHNEAPWVLRSTKGHSNTKRDILYFEDHVRITQQGTSKKPSTEIKTNSLAYHVNDKTAETAEQVLVQQDTLKIKSVGAFINLKTHLVKFLSESEGFYG